MVVAALVLGGAFHGGDPPRDPRIFDAKTPGVLRLLKAMREDSPAALYDAISPRARGPASRADFIGVYERQRARTGRVTRASAGEPFRSRDTADGAVGSAIFRVAYDQGPARGYTAYFVFEDREWRFWFTAPLRRGERR